MTKLDKDVVNQALEVLGADTFNAIIGQAETQFSTDISPMLSGALPSDDQQVQLVHKMAGSCAVLGAATLQAALADLEHSLKSGGDMPTGAAAQDLQTLADESFAQLKALAG
jgi:HPt (histidine-containing phosphotransfer) domain-containing protein